MKKEGIHHNKKHTVGWNEHVDLPDWGITGLRAKIDSGARTSSLDVDHIELLPNGKIRFNVVLSKRNNGKRAMIITDVARISEVKASPVHKENRVFVKTRMRLGSVNKIIEINLVDRSNMVYRMLLGRSALKGDFLVNVSHSGILTRRHAKLKRREKNK